jgi:hypothetical protein
VLGELMAVTLDHHVLLAAVNTGNDCQNQILQEDVYPEPCIDDASHRADHDLICIKNPQLAI